MLAALYSSQKLALDPAGRHEKKMKSAFSGETTEDSCTIASMRWRCTGRMPASTHKIPLAQKNASDGRQFALQADQKHSTIAGHLGSSHVSSSSVCRPCPLYSLFSLPAWI